MSVDLTGKTFCYWLDQAMVNDAGLYNPCVVVENEAGYYPTDWGWGKDWKIAQQCLREQNERMGINEVEMHRIVDSSMRESMLRDAIKAAPRKKLPKFIGLPKSKEVRDYLEKRLASCK